MLNFKRTFCEHLPGDPEETNYIRQVDNACYSFVKPTPVRQPKVIATSSALLTTLGLSQTDAHSSVFTDIFSGNQQIEGMSPYAMCYGGHQFGNWAGQLGDGRAINLGEVDSEVGEQTLQLKGAGVTPYSRHADGLAVLRSSIREYLCSEAMHHLGVPTTRALSLLLSGEQVERDMFYDGNPQMEPGAIVCRVAPSFLRFGSFELFASKNDLGNLKILADFCIQQYFPDVDVNSEDVYLEWYQAVCQQTLEMIIHWQRVGFVHGVMNTDNMSILGLTIDYGPYGWIDNFDLDWTPNTTDLPGRRYAFGKQAQISHWNLYKLAEAIYPLIGETSGLESILKEYPQQYQQQELDMQRSKLGLVDKQSSDENLVEELKAVMTSLELDMTLFYRQLADLNVNEIAKGAAQLMETSYLTEEVAQQNLRRLEEWLTLYSQRLEMEASDAVLRKNSMNQTNPWFVLRNYLSQQVIEKAQQGDYSMLKEIEAAALNPYSDDDRFKQFSAKRPEWAKSKAGCSMLSCSS